MFCVRCSDKKRLENREVNQTLLTCTHFSFSFRTQNTAAGGEQNTSLEEVLMELTRKQRQLMDCVGKLMGETGVFPTLRELADCMGIRSVSTVHAHIRKLQEKGVALMPVSEVLKAPVSAITIPLFGWVVAGTPSDVCEFQENIEVPAALVPNPTRTYALRITGDSMIEEHICEGDIVIVEKRDTARDGDIVIALVNGSETTVKRFRKEGKVAVLAPANHNMTPIRVPLKDVEIQGVVIGVVRKY